jgi:hypothetical protein
MRNVNACSLKHVDFSTMRRNLKNYFRRDIYNTLCKDADYTQPKSKRHETNQTEHTVTVGDCSCFTEIIQFVNALIQNVKK